MQSRQASYPLSEPLPSQRLYATSKRAFDLVVGLVSLGLLWPLIAAIAIWIRLDSAGSPFFRQQRIGRDAKPFMMTKFRTMTLDNDDSAHRDFMARHVQGESESRENEEGDAVFLLEDDRITRVGKFLRRTSLDELPNLMNVLAGSMSVVGPRPPIPYEVEHYDDTAMRRLGVKPGMTGYAQIRGRGSLTFDDMVRYDLEYIEERSFWTDMKVLVATIPAVLLRRGV
ncbi:MAG: sugar transferase [Actinomycetota bacterium]|nr:sugar transferase [Actinomycetota bacterium]MDK1103215.1 sugar transferase [Actinomycetota bacterium]MDK1290853.1 sugar transferase [Actinomycetota bacterium]